MSAEVSNNQLYSTYTLVDFSSQSYILFSTIYTIFYYFRNSLTILYCEINLLIVTIFEKQLDPILVALLII